MIRWLFFFLFILVFLRPHPDAFGALQAVYIGDFAVIILLVISILIAWDRRGFPSKAVPWIGVGFMALIFLYTILILSGEAALVIEASKFSYYFFLVVIFLYVFITPKSQVTYWWFNAALDVMVILLSIIAVIQLFEITILKELVGSIWGTHKLRGLSSSSPRVFSSFYNANWLGIVAAMLLVTYMRRILLSSRVRAMDWGLALLCLFLLLSSGSRSGLLAMMVGVILLFFFWVLHTRLQLRSIRFILLCILIGVSGVALLWPVLSDNQRIAEVMRFLSTGNIMDIPSAAIRIAQWVQSVNAMSDNLLFGLGKSGETLSPHNSFLFMALLFGVGGAAMVMLVFFSLVIAMSKGFRKGRSVVPLVGILIAGSFTAEFFFTTQVMLAFFLILACWYESGSVNQKVVEIGVDDPPYRQHSQQAGLARHNV